MSIPKKETIIKCVREAGIVGAGGAGFPTHIKIASVVDTLIVNIAECEPLLYKDKEIVRNHAEKVLLGIDAVLEATSARCAIIAIKKKYSESIEPLSQIKGKDLSISYLDDYYPAGDEIVLTYETTGRIVSCGDIPPRVGVLVLNAETLYNIAESFGEKPVTQKCITVTGAVDNPVTLFVPIGTMIKDILDTLHINYKNHVFFLDGIMMGTFKGITLQTPITKRNSGIVLLPHNHPVVQKRSNDIKINVKQVKSACDQCSYCTEFCPRYLIGHAVEPHRVMRTLSLSLSNNVENSYARGCTACSLCTLFACPEDLSPDRIMVAAKMRDKKDKHIAPERGVHPMRNDRKVSTTRLIKKLSLQEYDTNAPLVETSVEPETVIIPLIQHIGERAIPIVRKDTRVKVGELIAKTPEDQIGIGIHASIDGKVKAITQDEIVIERSRE
jgi:Na+-translocating ferredoxin:NAD+ oxidoreductase RnfC subunit